MVAFPDLAYGAISLRTKTLRNQHWWMGVTERRYGGGVSSYVNGMGRDRSAKAIAHTN